MSQSHIAILKIAFALSTVMGGLWLPHVAQARSPLAISLASCTSNIVVQNGNNSGAGSLPQAVLDVCEEGTITFDNSYTIILSKTLSLTKSMTIDGNGHSIIVDGNQAIQIFNIDLQKHVTLNNLTMQNGYTTGDGGGIHTQGALTLTNSILRANWAADHGGGIYASGNGGSTFISNTQIISNTGWDDGGGGLYAEQPITIINSAVNTNTTSDSGGAVLLASGTHFFFKNSDFISNTNTQSEGGGLYLDGAIGTIQSSRILSNTALGSEGAGLYLEGAIVYLLESEVAYNRAKDYGGGIDVYDENTHLSVTNSYIHHNVAEDIGGGIYSDGGVVTVTHSTLAYNFASNEGGAIYLLGRNGQNILNNNTFSHNQATKGGAIYVNVSNLTSNPGSVFITMTHTTIVSNSATQGGGIYLRDAINGNAHIAQAMLQNSIIAGNTAADCVTENGWEILDASLGYNLDSDGTCIAGGGTGNQTNSDPKLGPLQNNGGDTKTHALLLNSPARNVIPIGNCPLSHDQRGITRPQDEACDIGAYEAFKEIMYLPFLMKNYRQD